MKKIGVLAVKTHNYGSILQTYALQKVLDNMGYDNEIIDYKKTNIIKQATRLLNFPLLKQTIHTLNKKLYVKFIKKELFILFSSRTKAFNKFIDKLKFSKVYVGRKSLIEGTANYTEFILGSDQVWNPMNLGGDFFTMTFVPDKMKKIAYAPSFGVKTIPNYQIAKTKFYLNRIDFLSVRELSGQKLIKDLTGREAKIVVDPTILLERKYWDELRGVRLIKDPYIMCYFLGGIKTHREFAIKLQKKTGLKIVSLPHMDQIVASDFGFGDIVLNNIGPSEFINLISNAEYVCTDSFHGTVFSILYERIFVTFNRYNTTNSDSTNSRLNSILDLVGLSNRFIKSDFDIDGSMFEDFDYESVNEKLQNLRKDSMIYLKEAIEG